MVQIVNTIHRSLPKIVDYAKKNALVSRKAMAIRHYKALAARFSQEERTKAYNERVALNAREGIKPLEARAAKDKRPKALRYATLGSDSRRKPSMPKLTCQEEED